MNRYELAKTNESIELESQVQYYGTRTNTTETEAHRKIIIRAKQSSANHG
jgi:hypothetical protein